jgi:hypothetical protein
MTIIAEITQNWRGRPLISHEVIINLISHTVTKTGLKIEAGLDSGTYQTGQKVTDEEFATIKVRNASFHGDWNYSICFCGVLLAEKPFI